MSALLPEIFPDWTGKTCAVVAGGSSAEHLASVLRGRCKIIVVNLAFRLIPDADILYAADSGFWLHYRDAHKFQGLKLSADRVATQHCSAAFHVDIPKVQGRRVQDFIREPVGRIGDGGGNGGAQAVNLAVQTNASTILLAGLDYQGPHWHPDHGRGLRNPSPQQFLRWRKCLDAQAFRLREWGVRVINLSNKSTLRAYPHDEADRYLSDQVDSALST